MRRCSASIAANIAEGCDRRGNGEFHRFLQIASGSASELEYHLLLARDLGYVGPESYQGLNAQVEEVRKMLSTLARKVDSERTRAGTY
jgi:four helix bundle protein